MIEVVIVDAIRTPMGRSKGGMFRHVRAEALSAHIMNSLLERNPAVAPDEIEDIIWGNVKQTKEQGFNIARNAQLLSNIPANVGAVTVNRLCGSSMQALHHASASVLANQGDIFVVGGVEHMGHVPMMYDVDFAPHLSKYIAKASGNMGLTAELLAQRYQISKEQQDIFALRSHQNASIAQQKGYWQQEIISTLGHNAQGALCAMTDDEVIRHNASLEALSILKPVFDPVNGSITAGSSSALSDGASGMLVMSAKKANALNVQARFKIRAIAVVGCEAATMGLGPVYASEKALKRANLSINDIEVIELNEAFSAQSIACLRAMNIEDEIDNKVNLYGGAIALGHPLGCSGARIITTLCNVMEQKQATLGLATMCIGLGQGISTVIERL